MAYKYDPPDARNPASTRADIEVEFSRWNQQAGTAVVTDWDLPMAKTGLLYAEVTFLLRGQKVPVRVDRWGDFSTNLRCCYLVIRDMRLAEARGVTAALQQAYAALPAPKQQRDPWEVLQLRPGASVEMVEAAYRMLAKTAHPDAGGSDAAMAELNDAKERALAGVAS